MVDEAYRLWIMHKLFLEGRIMENKRQSIKSEVSDQTIEMIDVDKDLMG